ncbi:MAG: septal ring lytic transglycosylase RlpA family protein [Cytophagales bacterium]|nr:septal ring lytic transglycosylase RlpA family protein [Cytophagales bacterium]MDW8383935.1 septal ring lytic transglycosylase RlpA family protein [Flammeovirgaceae bacterium]
MKFFLYFFLWIGVAKLTYSQNEWEKVGFTQTGKASFYANKFHGRKTASGEIFDMYAMTGAHPLIPFNSIVKVTNLANGKWVTVRINDRGPFSKTRIIDVSKAAALKLDMVQEGTIDVMIELLKVGTPEVTDENITSADTTISKQVPPFPSKKDILKEEIANITQEKLEENKNTPSADVNSKVAIASVPTVELSKTSGSAVPEKTVPRKKEKQKITDSKKEEKKKIEEKIVKSKSKPKPQSTASAKSEPQFPKEVSLSEKFKPVNTYSIWGTPRKVRGFGLQIGVYSDISTAISIGKEAMNRGLEEIYVQAGYENKKLVYRIIFGAKPTEEEIKKELVFLKAKGYPDAFVRKHFE